MRIPTSVLEKNMKDLKHYDKSSPSEDVELLKSAKQNIIGKSSGQSTDEYSTQEPIQNALSEMYQ